MSTRNKHINGTAHRQQTNPYGASVHSKMMPHLGRQGLTGKGWRVDDIFVQGQMCPLCYHRMLGEWSWGETALPLTPSRSAFVQCTICIAIYSGPEYPFLFWHWSTSSHQGHSHLEVSTLHRSLILEAQLRSLFPLQLLKACDPQVTGEVVKKGILFGSACPGALVSYP